MFDEHIVEIQYNDNVVVSRKDVFELYELLDSVTDNRKHAKLLIVGKDTKLTEEAKNVIISENEKRKDFILAEAIIVHTLGQRIITNLYIKFVSSFYPTQCFDQQEKALNWLSQFIKIQKPL